MKPVTDVHELFRRQRAIRTFTDADVSDELVNQVLTAAIHGPSGSNTQPWHFIVIRDPRVVTVHLAWIPMLGERLNTTTV